MSLVRSRLIVFVVAGLVAFAVACLVAVVVACLIAFEVTCLIANVVPGLVAISIPGLVSQTRENAILSNCLFFSMEKILAKRCQDFLERLLFFLKLFV